jgi:hypothetical protein
MLMMGAPKIWSKEISVVQNEQTLHQQVWVAQQM